MRGITKSFFGVPVLDAVDLDVHGRRGPRRRRRERRRQEHPDEDPRRRLSTRRGIDPARRRRSPLRPPAPGAGAGGQHHLPGVQPPPRADGRPEHLSRPRAGARTARRQPRDGGGDGQAAGRARRRGRDLARLPGARALRRPAANGRDRQGALVRRPHPGHGRADRRAFTTRGRRPLRAGAAPSAARSGGALHLAPAERGLRAVAADHRPQGRTQGRHRRQRLRFAPASSCG